jgi:membrane associated rhomboid family serine protease
MYPDDLAFIRSAFSLLLPVVMVAWLVHLLDEGTGKALSRAFALYPRSLWGLLGIATSPFLHGDWQHLWTNTLGFLFLGWLVAAQGVNLFLVVTVLVALACGALVWLTAPVPSVGASGINFGYMGFLLVYGLASGSLLAAMAGLTAGLVYGHTIGGIFPRSAKVCWQAHLFGLLSGAAIALYFAAPRG